MHKHTHKFITVRVSISIGFGANIRVSMAERVGKHIWQAQGQA